MSARPGARRLPPWRLRPRSPGYDASEENVTDVRRNRDESVKTALEIRPAASAVEAEAIRVAVERVLRPSDAPPAYVSRWRLRGVLESLGVDSRDSAAPE